jgi:hypothetical protein
MTQFRADMGLWRKDESGIFNEGLGINQMLGIRERALMTRLITQESMPAETERYLTELEARGITVPAESQYVLSSRGHELSQIRQTLNRVRTEAGAIVDYEYALETMKLIRNNGLRVAVAFGNFDVGTEGHKLAIAEFVRATTAWGDLFVLVGGDEVVRARKGPGRPYVPHQQRMEFVANQPGVRWVVPIIPKFRTVEDLPGCYGQIHEELSGRVHFRAVGDREETISRYLEQCNQVGITLLYSDVPRITSATVEGARRNWTGFAKE